MALLTLVENAVRHGIDPSEQGGRIEVGAPRDGRAARSASGSPTPASACATRPRPGTGLANLRERLQAFYGGERAARAGRARAARRACRDRRSEDADHRDSEPTTALIADDEPLLRERLRSHLARLWPELEIVAEARNGREAVELFDAARAAGRVPRRAHAGPERHRGGARDRAARRRSCSSPRYEQYAVQAFEQGAIDYLVKPFDEARLADTVQRLQSAAGAPMPTAAAALDAVLERLASS